MLIRTGASVCDHIYRKMEIQAKNTLKLLAARDRTHIKNVLYHDSLKCSRSQEYKYAKYMLTSPATQNSIRTCVPSGYIENVYHVTWASRKINLYKRCCRAPYNNYVSRQFSQLSYQIKSISLLKFKRDYLDND